MIRRISFPACGCKLTHKASGCQEIQWGSHTASLCLQPRVGWLCTVLLALEMFARRVHCWPRFPGINTEDTEKSHRVHKGLTEKKRIARRNEKCRFLCGSL